MIGDFVKGAVRGGVYTAAQLAKTGWYTTQYVGARHLAGPLTAPGHVPKPYSSNRPDEKAVRQAFFALLAKERADIAKGTYKLPRDFREPPSPFYLADQARRYFKEARAITRRSYAKGGATEVRETANREAYPPYYLQNFHFQTDGWLSDQSAEIYDTQVEALFTGAADMMRRRALPMLLAEVERLTEVGTRAPRLLDMACGTGRLLRDVVDNAPQVKATALDLSPAYLKQAKRNVPKKADVDFVEGAAETLPFEDGSMDIIMSVYLFHELPPKVRHEVAAEVARVLKPGGLYVHVDSAQYGDTEMDILLEGFPRAVHEPYYDHYCKEDLPALFGAAGLAKEAEEVGFLTKATGFRRSIG